MMGDQGTSDKTFLRYSPFEIQQWDEFQEQPTTFVGGTSALSFSNHLHFLPSPLSQPLVHPPAVPFRQNAHEEWSNWAFPQPVSGPLIGPSDCSEAQIQGRSCHSEDTLDLMTGSGVGADDFLTFPGGEDDFFTFSGGEDDFFTFPRGKDGGVTMIASGLLGLQPTKFMSDNPRPKPLKEIKSKKWKGQETSVLLQCMADGGHFCKGKQGAMHWDLICEEINKKNCNGPTRSKEQCQNRFDTLLKAYKDLNAYCVKSGKKFSEVTHEGKRDLKLATPLERKDEGWYNHLDIMYRRRLLLTGKAHKRAKLNPGAGTGDGPSSSSPRHPSPRSPAASRPIGSCESGQEPSPKQVAIPGFKTLNEELRSTLLNLIQACSISDWSESFLYRNASMLEVLCRRLAIVQAQKPLEIHKYVLKLWELKLVKMMDFVSDDEEDVDDGHVDGWVDR